MAECSACTAPSPHARLCPTCQMAVRADLDDIAGRRTDFRGRRMPSLIAELETTLARQARITGPSGRGGGDVPLPYHPRAGADAARLRDVVLMWAGVLSGQRQLALPARRETASLAGWLADHVHDLAQLHEAADAMREIESACERARRTINRPPDRRYVGPCEDCGADLYVPALGQGRQVDTVRCRNRVPDPDGPGEMPCGAEYPMQARRAWLLEQAYDRLLTAAEMSRAIRELAPGQEVSPNRIAQWAARGKLTKYLPHPRDPHRRPRYRVEDVIGAAREGARRLGESA